MKRATNIPGIPDIRDDNVTAVLRAIKTTLEVGEGRSGDPLDQYATLRDLSDLNLVDAGGSTKTDSGGTLPVAPILGHGGVDPDGYNPSGDLSTPPAPVGLEVRGGFAAIYLTWSGAPYRNHAFTEIWRSGVSASDLANAVRVGTTATNVYADPVEPDQTYYYWIRFVSRANVIGPWNSTTGTMGKSAVDVIQQIRDLSTDVSGSGLFASMSQRIGQIQTDSYIANRALQSQLDVLSSGVGVNQSRILELRSVTDHQATLISRIETTSSPGGGTGSGNRTFFAINPPDASTPGTVAGRALDAGDVWYDTDSNPPYRSYRWSGTAWVEYVTSVKVYYQTSDPAINAGGVWQDGSGRALRDGDLWYDSDDNNHPFRWNAATNTWTDIRDNSSSAFIATLEQTKIGYATLDVNSPLGPAGSVFDNNGAIWNNVASGQPGYTNSAQAFNSTHSNNAPLDSKVTWHVGLPFAQATKQVGISADGGATIGTVQQQFTALKTTDDGLLLQYTVKLDLNGYITGFGLASTLHDAVPSSLFLINADAFAIAPAFPGVSWNSGATYSKNALVQTTGPGGVQHVHQSLVNGNVGHAPVWNADRTELDPYWVDLNARLPFIARTSTTTINGKVFPPGVWMNVANIADATIDTAMIHDLTADKITTGTLTASVHVVAGKIYGGVDPTKPFAGPTYGNGYFLGDDGGTPKFYVGQADVAYAKWDGSAFSVKGQINATTGYIGGFTIANDAIYSYHVTAPNVGPSGIYMSGHIGDGGSVTHDDTYFRIGNPAGEHMVWDGRNLTIYGPDGPSQIVLSSGTGIPWAVIAGTPPASVNNSSIVIVAGAGGTISLTGASGSIPGVIMPGYRIGDTSSASTYIANAAIDTAQIANLAVGGAQIKDLAVDNAKIADLAVGTIKIGNHAVTVPIAASYPYDQTTAAGGNTLLFDSYAIVSFSFAAPVDVLTAILTTEMVQNSPRSGGRYTVTARLENGTTTQIRQFMFGIVGDAPRFAQTAVFMWKDVPAGFYWMSYQVAQTSDTPASTTFGNETVVVLAAMK